MAHLVVVPRTNWIDELAIAAPGATQAALQQALDQALREFTVQSGAWVVELWYKDSLNGGASDDLIPWPGAGAKFPDGKYYDFQAELETARQSETPDYVYAPGDPQVSNFSHAVDDYWPWDVLYVHQIAYWHEPYTPSARPDTIGATRTVQGAHQQNIRKHSTVQGLENSGPYAFVTYNDRPGAVQLQPGMKAEADTGGIVPWVSLGFPRPRARANNTPDQSSATDPYAPVPVIFERVWYDHILDGAIGKLCGQQDKPYTNPQLAAYHMRRFRNGIAQARDMAMRQFNSADTYWRYPNWV